MARVVNSVASRRRRKRVIKAAKGYRGNRSKLFRYAKNARYKALTWAYRDRKKNKGNFRRLWILRINAALKEYQLTYSQFIHQLKKMNINIDRKALSNLAFHQPQDFSQLVKQVKGEQ